MRALYEEVACTFVRALRDVVAELRPYRSSPLLTLLRGMESEIEITEADRITGQVRTLNDDISSLQEIKELAAGIEGALKKAIGYTYGPNVSIESALPDSMERLLQRLVVLVGDSSGSAYRGELQEQSLGVANLVYLALKLLEYELKLSTDRVAHFFLIEEPEAHIHTHIQKTLFSNLPSKKTQVIVSTHSTHISSAAKIASVNVLAKKDDHVEVYQPANGLSPIEITRLERYLDAVRSTLLFAKGELSNKRRWCRSPEVRARRGDPGEHPESERLRHTLRVVGVTGPLYRVRRLAPRTNVFRSYAVFLNPTGDQRGKIDRFRLVVVEGKQVAFTRIGQVWGRSHGRVGIGINLFDDFILVAIRRGADR